MASKIDLSHLTEKYSKEAIRALAGRLAVRMMQETQLLISSNMKERFQVVYAKAVSVTHDESTVVIRLDPSGVTDARGNSAETFVRGIEYGYGSGGVNTGGNYDLSAVLLASSKARTSRKGTKFMNVPLGRSEGDVQKLGGDAALKAAMGLSGKMRLGPGNAAILQPIPRQVSFNHRDRSQLTTVPAHATDPLEGLRRSTKSGSNAFVNFRTVSQNGKPWVGAPIPAHRLLRKLKNRAERIVTQLLNDKGSAP